MSPASRYMAQRIAGAKLVVLPSEDHLPWAADADAILDEIEEFLTGSRHGPGAGPDSRHDPVHRYRRLDGSRRGAGRSALA